MDKGYLDDRDAPGEWFEDAKKHLDEHYHLVGQDIEFTIINRLIQEVERLRREYAWLMAQRNDRDEQIESLRDGLKLEQLALFEAQYKEKIEKLEAENADLRNTIQSQGEALRDREGNMDGLVQKLRKWLYKAEKENAELKEKLDRLKNTVEPVHAALYKDMENLPYEISKMIDENFWELF